MAMDPLPPLIAWFESLTPETVPAIRDFYSDPTWFRDPFHEIKDRKGVEAMFQKMFFALEMPRFKVTEVVREGHDAFLVWTFDFTLKRHGHRITGCSHLKFDAMQRVCYHRDYWDAAEEVYEKIPLLGAVLRRLKNRF